jgi:hypothetical protein
MREIEFVSGSVHRIDFYGCHNVEACLFEPKTQSAGSGK